MVLIQKLILLSMLALILSPVASYAASEEEAMLAQASHHYDAKEYYFATTWLERLLKKYPNNPHRKEALLMISQAYVASDREDRAIKPLEALLKEYPDAAKTLDPKLLQLAKAPVAPQTPAPAEPQPAPAPKYHPKAVAPVAPATAPPAALPLPAAVEPARPSAPSKPAPREEQPPKLAEPAPAERIPAAPAVAQTETSKVEAKADPKHPYAEVLAGDARDLKDPVEPPTPPAAPPAPIPAPAPVAPVAVPHVVEPQKKALAVPPVTDVRPPATKAEPPAPARAPAKEAAAVPILRTPAKAAAPVMPKAAQRAEATPAAQEKGAAGVQSQAAMSDNFNRKAEEYTLKVGEYFASTAMADDRKKVADAGLASIVVQGAKKKAPVIRLEVAGCKGQQSAQSKLVKLKEASGEGFVVVDRSRKYHLYAGSYADQKGAQAEQQRLAWLGIKTILQKKQVDIPVLILTAGNFATEEAAREKLKLMEKQGLHPVVVKLSELKVTSPPQKSSLEYP